MSWRDYAKGFIVGGLGSLVWWRIKTPATAQPASPWQLTMAVGPAYDEITRATSKWLQQNMATIESCVMYLGHNADRTSVLDRLSLCRGVVLMVFFGHGSGDAFLTSPALGTNSFNYSGRHGRLCGDDDFQSSTTAHVVGYCCNAAKNFGSRLIAKNPQNRFLGFTDKLPIEIGTSARDEAFSEPMRTAILEILKHGTINRHVHDALLAAYEREHTDWRSGRKGGGDDRSRMVLMCLEEHARLLTLL